LIECEGLSLTEYEGLSLIKTRGRAEPLQAESLQNVRSWRGPVARPAGLLLALWLAMPCVAQVRHVANARASASLDELAGRPGSRESAPSVTREIYEPERAVRKRNALGTKPAGAAAAGAAPADKGRAALTAAATVPPAFGGFQALLDNFRAIPPDTEGAVGPRHVVTMLNTQVLIQSRTGVVRANYPVTLNNFWSPLDPAVTDTFDPRILYDAGADRWIASASVHAESAQAALLVAVTQTGDPGGVWNYFQVNLNDSTTSSTQAVWGDYPELGFNANWVVVSANMFRVRGGNYVGTNLYVFQKSGLYQNGAGSHVLFSDNQGEMTPVMDFDNLVDNHLDNLLDNQANTLYLMQEFASGFGPGSGGTIRISKLEGPVGSETFSGGNGGLIRINDGWGDSGPGETDFAPQLGASVKIDTGDSRLLNCVLRTGKIWCAHTVFLPAGAPTRSAAQWFEIDPASTPPAVVQLGRIDDPAGTWFYAYPSIAVNKNGDALVGYTRFSANDYPSAEFSFRTALDPPNSMQPDVMFKPGEASYVGVGAASGSNRWGDYSATLVDPADDLGFWTLQEYASSPPQGRTRQFGTWWAQVPAPSAGLNCTFTVSASSLQFTNDGGPGTVAVGANSGCPWMAASNAPWIAIAAGSPGSGKGTVQYNVAAAANATGFRTGTLTVGGQTITVTEGTPAESGPAFTAQGVVSAASYQGGGVAPGELIAIFGSNLGPATLQQPAVSAAGVVGTVAGGTRVLFDGTAAPMIYASSGQVSAVVPFGIQGHANTQVQVEFLGAPSPPVTIPVVNALPGIFTVDSSGKGAAANPAAAGSTIVLYATGGGAMTPAVADGATAFPTLSKLAQSVAVRVGGVNAVVPYAGVAPGIVAGVLQINVTIPAGVSGSAATLDVTIGGVTSQAGVTLAVR